MHRNVDTVSLAISDLIDRVRRELDMTQRELTHRMGKRNGTHIGHMLDGRTARTSTYARALEALGCELVVTVRRRVKAPGPERVQ